MGKIVKAHQPCLDPNCGSSDALNYYEDGSATCFSCKKYFPPTPTVSASSIKINSVSSKKNTSQDTIYEVLEYPMRGIPERGIKKEICEFYKVRSAIDEDGAAEAHYYPYEGSFKKRTLPKDFKWLGTKPNTLFGQDKFTEGGKRVVITEGEIDALSVAQAFKDHYDKIYPVVAIPSATETKAIIENRNWLRSFDEVILFMDADEAGQKAATSLAKIIGYDKVKIVKHPPDCKDANDILIKNGRDALNKCIWGAVPYSPVGILGKDQLWQMLTEYNNIESIPYPKCLDGLNEKLKGMRHGEITLFTSGTGCHGLGTEILMYNGSIKRVEEIVVGDLVMGDDNTPRTVLELKRGSEQLFEVSIRGKDKFICNASHILSVVNNDTEGRWGLSENQVVDVPLTEYLNWSDKRKHLSKTFKAGALEFNNNTPLPMHPYMLGVWLGDGYSAGARLSNEGDEIVVKLLELGVPVKKHETAYSWGLGNEFQQNLKGLNLIDNKHIPEIYLTASIENRLELLAGLLDTDGTLTHNCYEFSQKSIEFTKQVIRLANSLGFQATHSEQKENKFGICQRVWISGDGLERIPVAIERKKASARLQVKNPLRFKTEIRPLDVGDFYGFTLDGNGRYVLGNFIVTHNSGKSTIMREITLNLLETTSDRIGIISLEEHPAETTRKLAGMAISRNPASEEIPLEDLSVGFEKVFGEDRILVLDHQGSAADGTIIDNLEYMALVGCKYLIIDHITILVSEGAEGKTGNEAIDLMMNNLLRLVKKHNVWVGLVSHLRKTMSGKAFEEGELPNLDDVKGSGSIKQISFDIVAFARNMSAKEELERNEIKIRVLKSRYTGLTGDVMGAYYVYPTGRLCKLDEMPLDSLFQKLG
jgi:5S rRNA maturation endonuclease (ribonuclease M5)